MGSKPTWRWAFSSSIFFYFPSPVECPQGGASLTICCESNKNAWGWNRLNKLRLGQKSPAKKFSLFAKLFNCFRSFYKTLIPLSQYDWKVKFICRAGTRLQFGFEIQLPLNRLSVSWSLFELGIFEQSNFFEPGPLSPGYSLFQPYYFALPIFV